MPKPIESDLLRKIKLRRLIRENAEGNQKNFADKVGLTQSQISHLLSGREITDKMWQRILNSLGVKDVAIEEDYIKLKEEHELAKNMVHHGKMLDAYMKKYQLRTKDVAERLGVSSAMVSVYKTTEQFRPEIAEKITKLMVNNDPIFESKYVYAELPTFSDTERHLSDLSKCDTYRLNQKVDYDLDGAVVVKIETDSMEPTIRKESELLAVLIPENKYKYHTGLTVIHYADMIAIGDVQSNDILDKGYITLNRGKGAVLRVLKEDIQHLWYIVLGLNVKF
ncbi:helix-turn-helix domain-containing protein [Runella salmonicolor]|uniref:Helix-turn-helix transcriptional regulator n=1 Tax=Runella salmonicolor TaxID=2950278 RepID=A0ABT1FW25_9BACT|nr:helix-turn-helix transcriptional regulator [Runella salmonicolor]MCP1384873.1 helix-turn-helix transcriptional regulator [Runella salmonicolor]